MQLEISTPALLFPAISLLFLSYTNRFLHLSALIRSLHRDWLQTGELTALAQIENIRHRLKLIRFMQLFGAISLLLCVISMLSMAFEANWFAVISFGSALGLMAISLFCLLFEILASGGALYILLEKLEYSDKQFPADGSSKQP